ncbi:cytochrome C (plasmid) [Azospirillum sp. TSH58]|uniref:c-type cytochrome n=1 Tax=Azospirillum sp. TSH58 TaxID=664962 RepID=UPI000D5FF338|nr:cytochrome c [Azospirillum sp. TSH58]AWJ86257.1 cytochrome C [Azospirillum sp. TSH58]
MKAMKIGVGLAMGAAIAVAGVFLLAGPKAGADPTDDAQVAQGKAVYAEQCASCHGTRLEGQPEWQSRKPDGRLRAPPHDASGHTWHHPDADLFKITKQGVVEFAPPGYESDMPAFGGVLSDAEIWAVLAFIKSSWPEEIRLRHAAMSERAKK